MIVDKAFSATRDGNLGSSYVYGKVKPISRVF